MAKTTRGVPLPLVIGGGAVLAIVALAAVFVAFTSARSASEAVSESGGSELVSGASAPVEAYLAALVAGDAATALQLAPPGEVASDALLAPDVYARAGHPTGFSIISENVFGDSAEVVVSVDLNSQSVSIPFSLHRADEGSASDNGWAIISVPLASIPVGDVTRVRRVNLVPVDLTDVLPGTELPALPGTYVFDAPEPSTFLDYGGAVTAVAAYGSGASPVGFSGTLSDQGRTTVIDGVRSRVEHCMLSDAFRPTDCPHVLEMKDPQTYAVTDLTRRWTSQPSYTVMGSDAQGYAVVIHGGDIHIDYKRRYTDDQPWTPDQLTQRRVFDAASPDGVLVPFTIDPTGPKYDFRSF